MINRIGARMAAMLSALVLAGVVLLADCTPARAVGVCSVDSICFYDTSSDWYPMIDHDDADTSPGECLYISPSYQGRTSYIWNRADHQYYVYTGTQCSGSRGLIYANSSGSMGGTFNNSIRSFRRIG